MISSVNETKGSEGRIVKRLETGPKGPPEGPGTTR